MTISVASVVHGATDPTFASRVASKLIAADNVTFTEAERARIAVLSEEVRAELAIETNRIEGQLTSMLAHIEGQYESNLAKLKLAKVYLPSVLSFLAGALAATLILAFITR